MVKHSLQKMLEKYPYFLDKRESSNFYKITNVNNSVFCDLYNSLFNVYQSFHLNKKLLIWRTQDKPYNYETHFCCGYENIKTVKVYKNDILIHRENFTEEEEKTDYCWTYTCEYTKTNMVPIKVYKCTNCGNIYIGDELPDVCETENCNSTTYITQNLYKCNECGEIYFDNPDENGDINIDCKNGCNAGYTRIFVYRCLGDKVDGSDNKCGEIYIGVEPPDVCSVCGATHFSDNEDLHYNDETLTVIDNGMDFPVIEDVKMEGDVELNPIDSSILINTGKKLFVKVVDNSNNVLKNANVKLYYYSTLKASGVTDDSGMVTLPIDVTENYTHIVVFKSNYVSKTGETNPRYDVSFDYINNNYLMTIKLYNANIYNRLNIYDEEEDYNLRVTELDDVYDDEILRIPLPEIPDDKFVFSVETWDEYKISKGYPENDVDMGDVYDHDRSLDEIGKLNNIPRKNYVIVEDHSLYPLTEPPYNKYLTEDDYHYMKRIIEYNLRLWISLNDISPNDENYDNYIELLNKIGITEEEYKLYLKDTKLFREKYNPVTLEIWKKYSVPSTLVNREKYLLKLFDLRKHNVSYSPYKLDEDGNPIKIYNKWELDEDGNPLSSDGGKYLYKDKWEVVTDLSECWIPEKWEHKDKFCEGSKLYKTYFFVEPETLRPLPYENVRCDFKLMNSLAEDLDYDYHVYLEYYTDDEEDITSIGEEPVTENYYNLDSELINNKTMTVRFSAYFTDYSDANPYGKDSSNFIGSNDITFIPYNSCNADIYVDANSSQSKEDGSSQYPYKNLQSALDKVNSNKQVICLKSDIMITEPLSVLDNCSVMGILERNRDNGCAIEKNKKTPVKITNNTSQKFFNIIGNKYCTLKLVDLNLTSGMFKSYVPFGIWQNTNRRIEDYETVIIHGGLALLTVTLDKTKYYPSDIIKVNIVITDKNGDIIPNQQVELRFNNGDPITVQDSDGDGIIDYNLHTSLYNIGIYDLVVSLKSDVYFDVNVVLRVDCTKELRNLVYNNEPIVIESTGYQPNERIKIYIDGVYVTTVTADENGVVRYTYDMSTWEKKIIIFVNEDEEVVDLIIIQGKVDISTLVGTTFIKNFAINVTGEDDGNIKDGDIYYEIFTVAQSSKLSDFEGVLLDLKMSNSDKVIKATNYDVPDDKLNSDIILAEDGEILKDAITTLTYGDDSVLKFTRIGEFWRGT